MLGNVTYTASMVPMLVVCDVNEKGAAPNLCRDIGGLSPLDGHCFQVLPVFALPRAPEGIANSVAAFVVESGGAPLGNG